MSILTVKDLAAGYNGVPALRGVSLQVEAGEHVALIGPNGAGKSTLLKAISATVPSTGEVTFDGTDISRLAAHRRAEGGITHVPEGRQVFGAMTIEENLLLGAYRKEARPRVAERMELCFELFPVLKEKFRLRAASLSGGQQQMVAIGRGLMACPRLLLLDEPSMGLSPVAADEVFDGLQRLRALETTTVLLVEQRALEAFEQCDRAYLLESGEVTLEGATADLLQDASLASAYIGA